MKSFVKENSMRGYRWLPGCIFFFFSSKNTQVLPFIKACETYFVLAVLSGSQDVSSPTREQTQAPWKCRVLTTGPLGNFLWNVLKLTILTECISLSIHWKLENRWEKKWKPADAIVVSTFHFSLAFSPPTSKPWWVCFWIVLTLFSLCPFPSLGSVILILSWALHTLDWYLSWVRFPCISVLKH